MDIQLKTVADNPALLEAIKAHYLSKFDDEPKDHANMTDTLLGQIYRARLIGRDKVEEASSEIERLREPEKVIGGIAKHR